MKNLLFKPLKVIIIVLLILTGTTSCSKKMLDTKNPVTIVIWHYYNGRQLAAFDQMVNEFNNTKGHEIGIYVEAVSQIGVNELAIKIEESAKGVTGSEPMPNIFGSYADTAYNLDKLGCVVELDKYLTQSEINEYVPSFMGEGIFFGSDRHKIFPTAKSSETFMINKTTWDEFLADKKYGNFTNESLSTWEGIVEVAEQYYKWIDSKTPDILNDGKALFGIDSIANYFYVGSKQLGIELAINKDGTAEYNNDKIILRKLWDNFYIPMVKGYFASTGRYRSDDLKTGDLISYIGSTTGGAYFPIEITDKSGKTQAIDSLSLLMPYFKDGEKVAIQQGAGMVVAVSDEKHEYASVEFLKWFTDAERNIDFACESSYLPVKEKALFGEYMNNKINLLKGGNKFEQNTADIFNTTIEQLKTYSLYFTQPFTYSYDLRQFLENNIKDCIDASKNSMRELLTDGNSIDEAFSQIDHEIVFEAWYNELDEFAKTH